ncbi:MULTISPECIES: outer membrane protein assembly factor BamB family protein [unclassified Modestobacter]|uniref:outer membrane protein assembly factor BamB family protein n=1 Tax=unclassified Modestobacter TaxID=2643866 RepID=UPI0022AAF007|nr:MULTISPECIES: PQQ-binding-like beta-propeller repeat protein [unclassified Modestobacter]MCZ2823844.1 PQQ-binding-like beta-propeller repeat protein [Modestobacter sp. VKM Ac-2981]MCZ2852089.1 PQQ-binding-like beta-propeller repeat protein [Modestobacter sp. VKM Ac-2982]
MPLVRRLPLRVWAWTAVTLVVAAVAVLLWRASDVAATSRTTAAPAAVPDETPAAELAQAWSAATGPAPRHAVESGRVLVTDEDGVAMLDAATGDEAWHYRRANATLCDATAVDGIVVVAFRTTGRCNELTGLDASTGAREWYRNVRFRTDVDLASTDQILLASSPTGIVTIDPAGDNTRWRYAPPEGCRLVGSDVGSSGVVVLQRCSGLAAVQVRLLDGFAGDVIWTRDLDVGDATPRLAGVDRLVDVVVGDRVHVLSPLDGTPLSEVPLPALPAGSEAATEPLQQVGVDDVALLWARGQLLALDQATGLPRWQVPALGLPATGDGEAVTVPEDGAFVQRSLADGTELARWSTADAVPAGGRTSLVGPVVVYVTPAQVSAHR